ncbi:lipoyl domain-containing protein [Agrococcus sp. Marseille-P2731]|uniref:lipoyl domain-containing protein n=1 Tax=Agrococcus sp. Marseille-P2731 TaxID=1841862 RepID=UPI00093157B5|nr:lipoyl domain-containing protein [Agrococcus sp. Marseille-P2731]
MDIALNAEFLGDEEEADLVEWLVEDGSAVEQGAPIAQFETSKLVSEFVAPAAGTITRKAGEGDVVNLDDVFATIA